MIIRNAQIADKTEIMAEARRLAHRFYPELKEDVAKMEASLRAAIAAGPHYAKVAEQGGKVVGALIGVTHDLPWAQRRCCQISLWYSLVPGAGIKLLRNFRDWLPEQRAIRVAGLFHDFELDFGPQMLLLRAGFEARGAAFVRYN